MQTTGMVNYMNWSRNNLTKLLRKNLTRLLQQKFLAGANVFLLDCAQEPRIMSLLQRDVYKYKNDERMLNNGGGSCC